MPPLINALKPTDLEDLSRFLTAGFGTSPHAVFAAPDVLRWKYLEPINGEEMLPRSYVARDEQGVIIGHVGICRTAFEGGSLPGGRVPTLHMIDWLGSPGHRTVGASLMRKAHEGVPTQFGLGGSAAGRAVIKRGGYEPREPVSVYQRVLRPGFWLRSPAPSPASLRKLARLARGLGGNLLHRPARSTVALELREVPSFGPEIEAILEIARQHAILTSRSSARLNHLLRFPRGGFSGWHILGNARLRGFAILALVPQKTGGVVVGKVVDCLLDTTDPASWQAAFLALARELGRRGSDIAQTFAGTPWTAKALQTSGFTCRFSLEFNVRDREGRIPSGVPFHLMPIEADYAYT